MEVVKEVVVAAALLVTLAAPAWAGLREGWAAYDRGDYATAMQELRPVAEQGDAYAQSLLGTMYYDGEGVPQDYALAVEWYRKAAEQGQPFAAYNLGNLYFFGEGVPQDLVHAFIWYDRAASQRRDAVAMLMTPAQIAEAQKLARKWWTKHGRKK